MDFTYRIVVNGDAVLLPGLEYDVERRIPSHQDKISRTMNNFGLGDWHIIIEPMLHTKSGLMLGTLKQIHLSSAASEDEMTETLYHEIFHVKCPGLKEKEIEKMGKTFAELMSKYIEK